MYVENDLCKCKNGKCNQLSRVVAIKPFYFARNNNNFDDDDIYIGSGRE